VTLPPFDLHRARSVEEAHELVERGLLDEQEFRELTFLNPARLHCGANPDFFAGSVVEDAVRGALAADEAARADGDR